ncbi:hypothetical protein [Paenibacillus sp. TH7-28]
MENKPNLLIQAMESKGLRITSQRRWIAELFSVSTGFVLPRHMHAYQQTFPIDYCPLDNDIDMPEAFQIISHKFEVYGICGVCAAS